MSKSLGNYIGVTESPEQQYGKVMSLPDGIMVHYVNLVTRWPPEAATAAMNWAFTTHPNLNRMYAWCDPGNIGSRRVLEKLGMKQEGELRHHLKWDNEFRDQLFFGLLRDEWNEK